MSTETTQLRATRPGGVTAKVEQAAITVTPDAAHAMSCPKPTVLIGYEGTLSYPPYVVQQDVWQQIGAQTMKVCSEHEWQATCNQSGAPATGVKTYPDSGLTYTDWNVDPGPAVSTFSHLATTFGHAMPTGKFSCDWAYDLFFNVNIGKPVNPFLELMILTQWANVDFPNPQFKAVAIGGHTFDVYHSEGSDGKRFVQMYLSPQASKGTIHWLPIFHWLEKQSLLHPNDLLAFLQYGVEVLTTYGVDITFGLNAFSVTDARH